MHISQLDVREDGDGGGRSENESAIELRKSRLSAVWLHNTISLMFTTTVFRGSQQNLRLFAPVFYTTRRTYALSRFPQRNPGVARRRQHVGKDNHLNSAPRFRPAREDVPREEQSSPETSSLWQKSARSVNKDPTEGLRHLLMTHESLVVTRSAPSTSVTEMNTV